MQFRAKQSNITLQMDDRAAKLEAAFVRYLLECRGVDTSVAENGFPALDIDKVLWKNEPMHIRAKNERKVVYALLTELQQAGFKLVDIDDGEELTQILLNKGDFTKQAMEVMFNLDDCTLYVFKEGFGQHYIRFVFGNADDGSEVVADWNYTVGDPDGFNAFMEAFNAEKYV
jgi:hypothetical protein